MRAPDPGAAARGRDRRARRAPYGVRPRARDRGQARRADRPGRRRNGAHHRHAGRRLGPADRAPARRHHEHAAPRPLRPPRLARGADPRPDAGDRADCGGGRGGRASLLCRRHPGLARALGAGAGGDPLGQAAAGLALRPARRALAPRRPHPLPTGRRRTRARRGAGALEPPHLEGQARAASVGGCGHDLRQCVGGLPGRRAHPDRRLARRSGDRPARDLARARLGAPPDTCGAGRRASVPGPRGGRGVPAGRLPRARAGPGGRAACRRGAGGGGHRRWSASRRSGPRFAGKDALQQGNLELFPVHPNREKLYAAAAEPL